MAQEEKPAIEKMSFKEASQALETVVRSLESGELELEDALENYRYGTDLLKNLRERLENAEQQVQVLVETTQQATTPDTVSAPSVAFLDEEDQ